MSPAQTCPYCGGCASQAEWADIGVGVGREQGAPFHCGNCGATQIGPWDALAALSADERATGWLAPFALPVAGVPIPKEVSTQNRNTRST